MDQNGTGPSKRYVTLKNRLCVQTLEKEPLDGIADLLLGIREGWVPMWIALEP